MAPTRRRKRPDPTPPAEAGVYLWQATKDGEYSLYDRGLTYENFLRTSQIAMTVASCNHAALNVIT